MLAYILRRLLLIVPTLFGIMLLNFIIIQFAHHTHGSKYLVGFQFLGDLPEGPKASLSGHYLVVGRS